MAKVKKPVYGKKGGKSKPQSAKKVRKKGKGQGSDDGLIAAIVAGILSKSLEGRQHGAFGGTPIPPTFVASQSRGSSAFRPGTSSSLGDPIDRRANLPGLQDLAEEQRGRISEISGGQDVQAQTGGIKNLVNQLSGFRAKGGNLVNQLQQFQPLKGPGRGTLDEILQSGLPTDVGGITEAASIRAGQEFEGLSDKINERLASQGLLSSTARTGQIAQERGRLAERVGAAGLEAGVGAAEAASGRRQAGVGQELGASGQQLSGQQSALSGQLARSGQELAGKQSGLQGEVAAGAQQLQAGQGNQAARLAASAARASGGQSFISSPPVFTPQTPGIFQQPVPTRGGGGITGSNLGSGTSALGSTNNFQPTGLTSNANPANPGFKGNTAPRSLSGQEGGAVPDPKFEEFLVNIGRKISDAFGVSMARDPDPARKRQTDIKIAMSNLGGPEGAFQLFSNPELRDQATRLGLDLLKKGRMGQQTTASGDPLVTALVKGFHNLQTIGKPIRQKVTSGASELTGAFTPKQPEPEGGAKALPQNAQDILKGRESSPLDIQGSQRGRLGFQEGGPVEQNTVPITRLTAAPQDMGILFPTLEDPKRSFFEGGGEVPGQDTGQDTVPAMLRSEELVVTPELVERIEQAETPLDAMQIIQDLQQLAQKPLEFSPGEGEFIGQGGGVTGQSTLPPDILQRLATIFGRLTGEEAIPPLSVEELGKQFAAEQAVPKLQGPIGQAISGIKAPDFLPPTPQAITPQSIVGGKIVGGEPIGGAEQPPAPPSIPTAPFVPPQDTVPGPEEFPPAEFTPGPAQAQFARTEEGGVPKFAIEGGGRGAPPIDIPGQRGTVSELGVGPTTREERRLNQLESARRRQELISIAFTTDPVGGPVKQAALSNALQNAERQIASITDEIAKEEDAKAKNLQSAAFAAGAQASLDNAVSVRMNAETNRATAFSNITAQIQAAAAIDPFLAQTLNIISTAKGIEDPDILEKLTQTLDQHFLRHNIEVPGGVLGWIKKVLFGSRLARIPEDSATLGPADRESERLISGFDQPTLDALDFFGAR